jgi:hypothetical protein
LVLALLLLGYFERQVEQTGSAAVTILLFKVRRAGLTVALQSQV